MEKDDLSLIDPRLRHLCRFNHAHTSATTKHACEARDEPPRREVDRIGRLERENAELRQRIEVLEKRLEHRG